MDTSNTSTNSRLTPVSEESEIVSIPAGRTTHISTFESRALSVTQQPGIKCYTVDAGGLQDMSQFQSNLASSLGDIAGQRDITPTEEELVVAEHRTDQFNNVDPFQPPTAPSIGAEPTVQAFGRPRWRSQSTRFSISSYQSLMERAINGSSSPSYHHVTGSDLDAAACHTNIETSAGLQNTQTGYTNTIDPITLCTRASGLDGWRTSQNSAGRAPYELQPVGENPDCVPDHYLPADVTPEVTEGRRPFDRISTAAEISQPSSFAHWVPYGGAWDYGQARGVGVGHALPPGLPSLMDSVSQHTNDSDTMTPPTGIPEQSKDPCVVPVGGEQAVNESQSVQPTEDLPLMEHQIQGKLWMQEMEASDRRGGILADEMGLGKTIQTLSLIAARPSMDPERHATLVVMPVGLIEQWKQVIEQIQNRHPRSPRFNVYMLYGTRRRASIQTLNGHDIVLTTYGTVVSELRRKDRSEGLSIFNVSGKWHRLVLDEAQIIKDENSKTAKACRALDATYRWCLSGTPMMNDPRELRSLLRFLRIRDPTKINNGGGPRGHKETMANLQQVVKSVLLRRTKQTQINGQPIVSLPARKTEKVYVVLNDKERQVYSALQDLARRRLSQRSAGESANRAHALGLLQRLRQVCCHPVLAARVASTSASQGCQTHHETNAWHLSLEVVSRLRANENIRDCPICMEEGVENPVIFPCGHTFCEECYRGLFPPSRTSQRRNDRRGLVLCPSCRTILRPEKATDYASFVKCHQVARSSSPDDFDFLLGWPRPLNVDKHGEDSDGLVIDIEKENDPASYPSPTAEESRSFSQWRSLMMASEAGRQRYQRVIQGCPGSAKLDKAIEIIDSIQGRGMGEKIIIFSQFMPLLDIFEVSLARRGQDYRRYDGSMTQADRNCAVQEFADTPGCTIMLISLRAGNTGLNLTAASQVILLDPCWNPYIEEQAIGRVHRIGQQKDVQVYHILVAGTVEDRILNLQHKKRELIQGVFDDQGVVDTVRLGRDDLAYLLVSHN